MSNNAMTASDLPQPDKIVNYAIAGDEQGGALFLYGDSKSSKIVICCGGYADDHSIFQSFASRLAKENECFVGVMCLPGFDDRPEKPWTSHKKDGYTLDEMANSIREAVKVLMSQSTCSTGPKLTGIFHDWASLFSQIWLNRIIEEGDVDLVDRVVQFDVLLKPHKDVIDSLPAVPNPTIYEKVVEISYRFVLTNSFLLQRYVSKYIAAIHLIFSFILLTVLKIGPLKKVDTVFAERYQKSLFRIIYMAYPYWFATYGYFFRSSSLFDEGRMHKNLKKTPMLYMYGIDKNVQFHDLQGLNSLKQEEKEGQSISKAIGVEGAGHYLFGTHEDVCFDAVKKFMSAEK